MARALFARSKSSDDLPLARRSSPPKRLGNREIRLIAFLMLLIAISFNLFISKSNRESRFLNYLQERKISISEDGRLLGHFPYPEVSKDQLSSVYPGLQVHKDTFNAYRSMRYAASLEGINLILLSGYRSHSLQEEIFFDIKSTRNQTAAERAKVSAPPGYSEHSTGYAIDIGDASRRDTDFEVTFESTPAFQWLYKNAAKYHFILSFPRNNPQGVSYEPWHWRFEGTADSLRRFEPSRRFSESL